MIWWIGQYSLIQIGRCLNLLDVSVDCIKSATKSRHVSFRGVWSCYARPSPRYQSSPWHGDRTGREQEGSMDTLHRNAFLRILTKAKQPHSTFDIFFGQFSLDHIFFVTHQEAVSDNFSDCSPLPVFRSPYSQESKLTKKRLSWNLWRSTSCSHS